MMLDTADLYIMVPVWMTVTFSQSQMGADSKNVCKHSIARWHEGTHLFVIVDNVMVFTSKKTCRFGEYGSFEYLLLLFV